MQDSTPSPPAANVVVSCSISPIKRQWNARYIQVG
jgi:hypothetical protein